MNQGKEPEYKEIIKSFTEDCNYYETEDSEVSKFFSGKFVFITGGTGFLGKLTIEKLLRTCPNISGIFMLVRTKKGKDVHTRVDEMLNDVVFDRLGKRFPKFRYKIHPVAGDVGLPGLGLRIEDRKILVDQVSIIFHIAATLRFDEKLNIANNINVKGTEEALSLAKECQNLISFVHVSTAYSNCPNKEIKEIFYDCPINPEKLTRICDNIPAEILDKITPDLVGKWPNTYTYTKAIAEDVIRVYGENMPICIFRPSIVLSTYKEPIKSWIDNIYGPTGYFLGCALGLTRTLNANRYAIADIVPADFVINGMIVAAHQNAIKKEKSIDIYNYVSSVQRPITWNDYCEVSGKYGLQFGPSKAVWYYNLMIIQSKTLYLLYAFFVHIIPALLVDLTTVLIGKKPELLKIYKKIHKFNEVLSYFGTRKWTFSNDNTQALFESLSDVDRKIYNFDMESLDWTEFMKTYGLGVREYILKDPVSTVEDGRKRFKRLRTLHYGLLLILSVVLLNVIYRIFHRLFLNF